MSEPLIAGVGFATIGERPDLSDLDRALDMIERATAVHIIGLRRSFPVAAYLAYALRHVDKRARKALAR